MHKWFCFKKNAKARSPNTTSTTTTTTHISSSLSSSLDKLNLTEERLKRYVDEANVSSSTTIITNTEKNADTKLRAKSELLREETVSKTLDNVKRSINANAQSPNTTSTTTTHISSSLASELDKLNLTEERLKR